MGPPEGTYFGVKVDPGCDQVTSSKKFQPLPSASLTRLESHSTYQMAFTKCYASVLSPFVEKFREAKNEKDRKTVVKNAADAVTNSKNLLEDEEDLPKDLQTVCNRLPSFPFLYSYIGLQAISRFIKRCVKKASEPEVEQPKPKKVKKIYTIRDVIKQHYRSRVEEEIPFKSNDKEYLGSYQKAVSTVLNNMTEEDLEEAEDILELWNKEGGPSDIQLK